MRTVIRALLVAALLGLLCGCDQRPGESSRIDAQWHRRSLIEGHLSKWLVAAPTDSGLFKTAFNRQWKETPTTAGDLTEQCRLIYAMVLGYELTGDQRYLVAGTRGADFLLAHFHDPVYGGYFGRIAADGKVLLDSKRTYGHAFALLAMAHMFRVTKQDKYRVAAMTAWREISLNLRDARGGFRPEAPRDFGPTKSLRTQNPVMHMFEALLALNDATGDPVARAGAESVGKFVLYHLLAGLPDGSAFIPEWYDEDWQPLPTKEKGGYIDIGHQFEWSHLLLSAERQGLTGVYGATSARLLQYALKVGYDETGGGSFNRAYPDGTVDRDKLWWQQSECIRALVAAASIDGRNDLWRRYEQTLDMVREEFIDEKSGGWRPGSVQVCKRGGCSDTQPDPYPRRSTFAFAPGHTAAGCQLDRWRTIGRTIAGRPGPAVS